jgi:propionyl-CoA carboxylase alpha chain
VSASKPVKGRFRVGRDAHAADLRVAAGRVSGTVDGAPVDAGATPVEGGRAIDLDLGGRLLRAVVLRTPSRTLVSIGGLVFEVSRASAADDGAAGKAPASDPFAASPMTGVVTKVHVKAGDAVERGAALFAVEAMKMEYVVSADRPVTIAEVRRAKGDKVAIGEVVVRYAEPPPT